MSRVIFYCFHLIFLCFSLNAQNYAVADLKTTAQTHQKIAILPFQIKLESQRELQNISSFDLNETTRQITYQAQTTCYYILAEKPAEFPIQILDLHQTNQTVKNQLFIMSDTSTNYSFQKITDSLKVDAVLIAAVTSYDDEYLSGRYHNTKTSKYNVDAIYYLFEAKTGRKLWQHSLNSIYDLKLKDQYDSLEQIIEALTVKAMQYLPYRVNLGKKKK